MLRETSEGWGGGTDEANFLSVLCFFRGGCPGTAEHQAGKDGVEPGSDDHFFPWGIQTL